MPSRRCEVFIMACIVAGAVGFACRPKDDARPSTNPNQPDAPAGDLSSASRPGLSVTNAVAATARVARMPRPASTLPANANCSASGCHGDLAAADFVHAPVAANSCFTCHGTEGDGHKFPLKKNAQDTCTMCHVVFTGKSHKHKPAADGDCTSCHDPHASGHKFLLRQPLAESCQTCHPPTQGRHAHGPYAVGACTACHAPHEADNPRLTIAAGSANCFRCHSDMQTRLAAATTRHPPVDQNCGECHLPHRSDQPKTLKQDQQSLCLRCHADIEATVRTATEQHGALFMQQGCGNCHDAHGSGEPALLKDRMADLCLKCHDRTQPGHDGRTVAAVADEITKSANLHGPVKQGQCQACHQVHGSANSRLLTKYFPSGFYEKFEVTNYALCFSCHEKAMVMDEQTTALTGFRNGDRNLHFTHVQGEKGRSCKACHAIHGSNQPKHVAASVPFDTGGWSMPINFVRTDAGGRCAPGCHQPYAYNREKPVAYPATQEKAP